MWTPRRIGLLLLGLLGFSLCYLAYSQFLGALDGLPALPPKYLADATPGTTSYKPPSVAPAVQRLREAFGLGSPEAEDHSLYPNKLQFQRDGIVFATGLMSFDPNGSRFVTVSPMSMAHFGKNRPKPGENPDISTFHADMARLEFSQPVSRLMDLQNDKAKLVGVELISVSDNRLDIVTDRSKREGYIWITNNQKSLDPGDHLVARTPGPVFYRVQEENTPHNPDVPQVWTAAAVQVYDRKNLPKPFRTPVGMNDPRRRYAVNEFNYEDLEKRGGAAIAGMERPSDLRKQGAIAQILLGAELPPPSITAEGLKIFLHPPQEKAKPGGGSSREEAGSIRLLILDKNIQMNIWTDGDSGFPGDDKPESVKKLAQQDDPPLALAGAAGSLVDGAAYSQRLAGKALVLVETPGAFQYDFTTEKARFDAAPTPPPGGQPNFVTVTRLSATGPQDNLFCKSLLLDIAEPAAPGASPGSQPSASSGSGRSLRSMLATGDSVYISIESEALAATGTLLKYTRDPVAKKAVIDLQGQPVVADRENNRLRGGTSAQPGHLIIESWDTTDAADPKKSRKVHTATVLGPGQIDLIDRDARPDPENPDRSNFTATWGKSLTHTKDKLGGKEVDLLKFDGGGALVDPRAEFSLRGDVLRVWLSPLTEKSANGAKAEPGLKDNRGNNQASPERVVADGNVDLRSPQMIVKDSDKLTVWFRDVPPPKLPALQPTPPVAPLPMPPARPDDPPRLAVAPDPEKAPKPIPVQLSARVVESWVVRYPNPQPQADRPAGKDPATPPAGAGLGAGAAVGSLKYDLERALCEDRVIVQQEPKEPGKGLPGLDVRGSKLNLDHSTAGSLVRIVGTPSQIAEVHYEGLSLFGEVIVIDQPNNTVEIPMPGRMKLLSDTDMNGQPLEKPSALVMTWTQRMQFWGAKAMAEFVGSVNAQQIVLPSTKIPGRPGPVLRPLDPERPQPRKSEPEGNPNTTYYLLQCHRLDLTFDRPVYFNQTLKEESRAGARDERPKLKSATCTPIPEDELRLVQHGTSARDVYFYEEVLRPDRSYAEARILVAKQIDFMNSEKEQDLKATGPGELRLLGSGSEETGLGSQLPGEKSDLKSDEKETKLTVVKFLKKLHAKDQAKVFQEAIFPEGATVMRFPTNDPKIRKDEHELPANAIILKCDQSLTVSSSKPGNGAKPETRLVASGNASFRDEKYTGNGGRVTYTPQAIIFEGAGERLASLHQNKVGVNERVYHQAKQIIYKKDGSISVIGSGGASVVPR